MDNKRILEKVQMKIAISKVNEEDIGMKKSKLNFVKKIGIAACALLSTTGVVFATVAIINKFGANSSDGSQRAVESGYIAYSKEDSMVDSFMLDNYNFYIAFKEEKLGLTLEDIQEKYDKTEIGEKQKEYLTIKNENNEVVFSNLNMAYSRNREDGKIIYTATAKEFPISKKLYIDFDGKKEVLEVPEFMQSEIVQYRLKSISDENWKFESATLSNTAFKIYLSNCDGISHNERNRVVTSDGKEYYHQGRSDGDGSISVGSDGIVKYYNTFNLTKFDATDNLKVYLFKTNGEEIIIELEKIK